MMLFALIATSTIALALGLWLAAEKWQAKVLECSREAAWVAACEAEHKVEYCKVLLNMANNEVITLRAENDKLGNDLIGARTQGRHREARAARVAEHQRQKEALRAQRGF